MARPFGRVTVNCATISVAVLLSSFFAARCASGQTNDRGEVLSRARTGHLPEDVPADIESWRKYADLSQSTGGLRAADYPGVDAAFSAGVNRYIRETFVPPDRYVTEHIVLLPAGHADNPNPQSDVAYLRYQKEKFSVLFVITGGSRLYAFFSQSDNGHQPGDYVEKPKLEALMGIFLRVDHLGPFETNAVLEGGRVIFGGTLPKSTLQQFRGVIWEKGIAVCLPLQQYGRPMPATVVSGNQWFSRCKEMQARRVAPDAAKASAVNLMTQLDDINRGDPDAAAKVQRVMDTVHQSAFQPALKDQLLRAAVNALARAETPQARDSMNRLVDDADHSPHDAAVIIEAVSKSLPRAQATDYCLTKLKEIAEKPDGMPERTIALMHCLPGSLSSDQTNTLMMVIGMARTPEIREAGYVILTRALVDSEEGRTDVTRILRERLADPEPRIRATAARGLGATGDVRCVRNLVALLDDPAYEVRQSAVRAICRLLNWKAPELREGADKPVIADVTARLAPVLKALEALDAAAKQPALR